MFTISSRDTFLSHPVNYIIISQLKGEEEVRRIFYILRFCFVLFCFGISNLISETGISNASEVLKRKSDNTF